MSERQDFIVGIRNCGRKFLDSAVPVLEAQCAAANQDLYEPVADEVMGGLTKSELEDMIGVLRRIHASGTTIIMIEHIVEAIVALSQRVVVLNFGKKLFEGTPAEVVEHPAVIESYLGSEANGSAHA